MLGASIRTVDEPHRKRLGPWELRKTVGALGPARQVLARDASGASALLLMQRHRPGANSAPDAWRRYATSPPPPHPGLLPVLDFAEDAEHFALVVEPRECRPLGIWFVDEQPAMSRCLDAFSRLVEAMGALHDAGFVHGAIRPDTVLMDRAGQPLLTGAGGLTAGPLGRTGHAGLEAVYQAPELVAGPNPIGPTSDIYALGCLLYFFGVGAHPWGAGQASAGLLRKKLEASFDPPLVTSRVPTRNLVQIIHRCTTGNGRDRLPDAAALTAALREAGMWSDGRPDTMVEYAEFFDTGSAPALPVSNLDLAIVPLPDTASAAVDPELEAAVILLRAAPGLGVSPHWPPQLRTRLLTRLMRELGNLDRRAVVTKPDLTRQGAERLPVLAAALRRLEGAVTLRTLLQGLGEPERLALLSCLVWLDAEDALRFEAPPDFWDEDW